MKNRYTFSTVKGIILLCLSVLIISCSEAPENITDTATQEQAQSELAQWEQDIKLNQGAPWRANKATSVGIVNMYGIIVESAPTSHNDYKEMADALNQEMNMLIQRCTMTGPSHDNLHVYLEPLLKKLTELKEAETAKASKQLTSEIQEHLMVYNKYFI